MNIPRPEYPRPQFVREQWLCLNGEWQFEIDSGDSGKERSLLARELNATITVPFCPESELSGVGCTDFMHVVWYRRVMQIPDSWTGQRVLLHFGAVDYDSTVWADGVEVGRHRGGWTPFTCDLGVKRGGDSVTIVLRARDEGKRAQARGKQSTQYAPHSCFYTRTTGIWQTVWAEPVPAAVSLKRPRITPDVGNGCFRVEQGLTSYGPGPNLPGLRVRARLSDGAGIVADAETSADGGLTPVLTLSIPAERQRLWSPEDPFLYDVEVELADAAGETIDHFTSYAGLRSVTLAGRRVNINGRAVFQRTVLDQGYYPDGVMTAPSDAALVRDIQLSLDAGFNGARLHQKVFEERFLYHADRMGYLVWGEFADWGASGYGPSHDHQQPGITYVAQWLEALERDYSHPCIIGWCPLNETGQHLHDRITTLDDATRALFLATKMADGTRPVLDTSGYAHRVAESDIYDSHDYVYEQDFTVGLKRFGARHAGLAQATPFVNPAPALHTGDVEYTPPDGLQTWSVPYRGQPYWVSEFGGLKWNPATGVNTAEQNELSRKTSWGYGSDPADLEDFYARLSGLCAALLADKEMFGFCYTQLTDVFPEENGVYFFDRSPKFDMARVRAIFSAPAAMENT